MAQARPKIPDELNSLPNTQWEYIIDNYIKSEVDRKIAKLYYLQGMTQIDVAVEVGYSQSSIKRKLPKILSIIEKYSKWTLSGFYMNYKSSFFIVKLLMKGGNMYDKLW